MTSPRSVLAAAALVAAMPGPAGAGAVRDRMNLSGTGWSAVETRDPSARPPQTGWSPRAVPSLFFSDARGGSTFAWYRRTVAVPPAWSGARILLRFAGVRWNARVFINGREAGRRVEGFTPWELDVTRLAPPGADVELLVRCQDWGATFADGFVLPADAPGDIRYAPAGKVLFPIGGHFTRYGIWDEVTLEARPPTFLDDVAISTSVRRGDLVVTGGLDGPGRGTIRGEVLDAGRRVLVLPPARAGRDGRWRLAAPFPNARRWSPEDPHRYELVLAFEQDGRGADEVRLPFGFRELWAEGPHFVFNGVRRRLLATSAWPTVDEPQPREQIRTVLRQIREANTIAFRLHTQPWREAWLEEADALGVLIIPEAALWCDGSSYAYADDRFWTNYRDHVAGMIRRDRNHASVVMWSLENELLHCGAGRTVPETERRLADLARFAKRLDPDRLVTFEADLDPGGAANVVGLHYPHELPQVHAYPDAADWLDREVVTGTEGGLLGSRHAAFRWDRTKPLYIGEYLWIPDFSAAPGTVFFGDAAYADVTGSNREAKARAWFDQTVAYRRAGVSGLCPWTMFESGVSRFPLDLHPERNVLLQAQRDAYVPVAAFPRERDDRFFAGDEAVRTFDVFNDDPVTRALALRWSLRPGGGQGSATLALGPAERAVVTARVRVPAGGPVSFQADLEADGRIVHRTAETWRVVPRRPVTVPAGAALRLLDPAGRWAEALARAGVRTAPVAAPDVPALDPTREILVAAPGAFAPAEPAGGEPVVGRPNVLGAALAAFLRRGGRLISLAQNSFAGLPLGADLVDHASTMAFPVGPAHPLLEGLDAAALSFWRPGHAVALRQLRRPAAGGARAPVVTGGPEALDQAAVLDVPAGRGRAILVQALAAERLETEPAARVLLENALRVAAAHRPPGRTAWLSADAAFGRRLAALGVDASPLAAPVAPAALRDIETLIVHGGGKAIADSRAALRGWLREGRTLYWHRPDPETFDALKADLGLSALRVAAAAGPLSIARPDHPLLAGVPREDLYFLGPISGDGWMRRADPEPSVIEAALLPASPPGGGRPVPAAAMTLRADASATGPAGSVYLFSNGTLATAIRVQTAGWHAVSVRAAGTPARGAYPLIEVRANGVTAARVALSRSAEAEYTVLADLPRGEVELTLAFVNDAWEPPEDRNLRVVSVAVAERPWAPEGLDLLAAPPALVERRIRGGRVILDFVRWEAPAGRNALRAGRLAGALLANAGAAFRAPEPEPDWVPPSAFRQSDTAPYFSATPARLTFGTNGAAEAAFRCAAAGRYAVVLRASGTPAEGAWPEAEVLVDERAAGRAIADSEAPRVLDVGTLELSEGLHRVSVRFLNDRHAPPEDRNLSVSGVGFRRLD